MSPIGQSSDKSEAAHVAGVNLSSQSLQQEFHRVLAQKNPDPEKQTANLASIIEQTADKAFRETDLKAAFRDFHFLRQEILELKENPDQFRSVSNKLESDAKSADPHVPAVEFERGANGEIQYLDFHLTTEEQKVGTFPEHFEMSL
jgi:hypothetical protein